MTDTIQTIARQVAHAFAFRADELERILQARKRDRPDLEDAFLAELLWPACEAAARVAGGTCRAAEFLDRLILAAERMDPGTNG